VNALRAHGERRGATVVGCGGGGQRWRCSAPRGKRGSPRERRGVGWNPKDACSVARRCVGAATALRAQRRAGPPQVAAPAHPTRPRQTWRSAAHPHGARGAKAASHADHAAGGGDAVGPRGADDDPTRGVAQRRGGGCAGRGRRAARDRHAATRRRRWGSFNATHGATGGAVAADGHNLPRSWHPRSGDAAIKVVSAWALQPLAGPVQFAIANGVCLRGGPQPNERFLGNTVNPRSSGQWSNMTEQWGFPLFATCE